MKHLIPKKDRLIKVNYPKNPGCTVPIIYIRYYQGEVVYVGETVNYYGGRHLRPKCCDHSNITVEDLDDKKLFVGFNQEKRDRWKQQIIWDNTDTIRILNAPKDDGARKRWEAKLVCWLNPKLQRVKPYIHVAHLDVTSKKDQKIIKEVNGNMILGRIATFSRNILEEVNDYKTCKRQAHNILSPTGFRTTKDKKRIKQKIETAMRRAFREHSQMFMYKNNFLKERSIYPVVEKQVDEICDMLTEKVNGLELN